MRSLVPVMLAAMSLCAASAWGQSSPREPHIGYVYPAGGQQRSVFRVMVGGQYLRGVTDVYLSGEGVRASVIKHYPPVRNLNSEQREYLISFLTQLSEKRWVRFG